MTKGKTIQIQMDPQNKDHPQQQYSDNLFNYDVEKPNRTTMRRKILLSHLLQNSSGRTKRILYGEQEGLMNYYI